MQGHGRGQEGPGEGAPHGRAQDHSREAGAGNGGGGAGVGGCTQGGKREGGQPRAAVQAGAGSQPVAWGSLPPIRRIPGPGREPSPRARSRPGPRPGRVGWAAAVQAPRCGRVRAAGGRSPSSSPAGARRAAGQPGPGRAGQRGAALRGRRRQGGGGCSSSWRTGGVSQQKAWARTERLRGCGQRAGTTPLYQVGSSRRAPYFR